MKAILFTFLVGVGATAVMDAWGALRKPLLGIAPPNYGLVGRWIAHMTQGRLRHESITTAAPVAGEQLIGWLAHYLIGIGFAGILIGIWGTAWLQHPTIGPALAIGVGTVTAPFFLMQPGMGAGIAGSRTRNPAAARLQSIFTHLVFGIGLYVSGRVVHFIFIE